MWQEILVGVLVGIALLAALRMAFSKKRGCGGCSGCSGCNSKDCTNR
ncbi:MAG: FeoB-associated Cys-rich membrane protein [Bacteroidales bacterium]|nr:FeoB-associated Cys-rich membrane protein [Bacteroidales bacterium]